MVDMSGQRECAVITGASSGIGLEIAKVLASQKYDLIISARREKELLELSNYISEKYSVDCKVVVADLTTDEGVDFCLLYTSPSPRDATLSRMPSSA